MEAADTLILFRVAQWVSSSKRKVVKTIRQLAETEENYRLIIREIDRVEAGLSRARTLGAKATLTLTEWLVTLEDFNWRCAYCLSGPFQILSHVIPLPRGGTASENCVPACYACSKYKKNQHVQVRVQTYLASKMNRDGYTRTYDSETLPLPFP